MNPPPQERNQRHMVPMELTIMQSTSSAYDNTEGEGGNSNINSVHA